MQSYVVKLIHGDTAYMNKYACRKHLKVDRAVDVTVCEKIDRSYTTCVNDARCPWFVVRKERMVSQIDHVNDALRLNFDRGSGTSL